MGLKRSKRFFRIQSSKVLSKKAVHKDCRSLEKAIRKEDVSKRKEKN